MVGGFSLGALIPNTKSRVHYWRNPSIFSFELQVSYTQGRIFLSKGRGGHKAKGIHYATCPEPQGVDSLFTQKKIIHPSSSCNLSWDREPEKWVPCKHQWSWSMATLPAQFDMGTMVTLSGTIGHHGRTKRSPSPGGIVAAKTYIMSDNEKKKLSCVWWLLKTKVISWRQYSQ